MTYYDTLAEDIKRAKEILGKGKSETEGLLPKLPAELRADIERAAGGVIFGSDNYPAYRLLESFVQQIEKDRTVMQRIMQVLGPEAVCECAGCEWETNEALRLLREEGGIQYSHGKRLAKPLHDGAKERRGNATDHDTQTALLVRDIKELAGILKFRKVNPFDHNGECLICDETGQHADDCAWRLVEMIRDADARS